MDVRGVFSRNEISNGSIAVTRAWAIRYDLRSSETSLAGRFLRSQGLDYRDIEFLAFLASAISLAHP